jgi:hypothetical protein
MGCLADAKKSDANPRHREDFTRLVDVAARKRPHLHEPGKAGRVIRVDGLKLLAPLVLVVDRRSADGAL